MPNQYNWYNYVINKLNTSYYLGIDADGRMIAQIQKGKNFDLLHMDMSNISCPDLTFDVAYCISTFEHIPYHQFMKCIQEAYRVLKDDGLLVVTLDEHWDKKKPIDIDNQWNTLELTLIDLGLFNRDINALSFSLPNFLELVKDYFVLKEEDADIDIANQEIFSKTNPEKKFYKRKNADPSILHSPLIYNSSVSYAVLKKVR